jgi:hypothetical protein
MAKFVQKDLGTDYYVAAQNKMLSGKESFFRMRGASEAFRKLRALDEKMSKDFLEAYPQFGKDSAEFKRYKQHLPLQRLNEFAFVQGSNNVRVNSYRARYIQEERQDLKDQLAQLEQMNRFVGNFASGVQQIMNQINAVAQQANVSAAVLARLEQELKNLGTSRHARGMLGRPGLDRHKAPFIDAAMRNAGAAEQEIDELLRALNMKA